MDTMSLYHRELLTNHYHPKVNAYYFKQWDSYHMPFHIHDEVEIMYVIDGRCTVDTVEESVTLKKGDFILLDANVSHRLIVDKNTPCRMLNVEFAFIKKEGCFPSIKQLADENSDLTEFLLLHHSYVVLKDPNEIYHTLKNLVLELDKREPGKEIMIHVHLAQLLMQIARMVVEEKEKKSEQQQANVYVKKTIEYLHHNYDRDIQVKDIGDSVNLHPGYLHRVFKKQTGVTVMEYLTSLRMEKAKMLLADTDIPIVEISYYIGINSRQYFSLLFKKYTDQTPVEYRKSIDQNIVKFSR